MNKCINVLCIAGLIVFVFCLHGCTNVPVTNPQLHDGRYGDYNEAMSEECAKTVLELGIKLGLSNSAIDALFNKCVFDQGLTI